MTYEYQAGMKMYEAVWERDGKRVGVWCMHAANEADVLSEAQAFFAEHPEYDFAGGRDGTTVRVGIVGGDGSIFSPDVIQAPKPES
jgi:hypothetical protein